MTKKIPHGGGSGPKKSKLGVVAFDTKAGIGTPMTDKKALEKTINWDFMEQVYNHMEGYVMDTSGDVEPFYRWSGIPAETEFQKKYVADIVKRRQNGEFVK